MESVAQRRDALPAAVLALSSTLFAAFTFAAIAWERGDELDVRFVEWVHRTAPDSLIDVMRTLTHSGSGLFLGLLAAVAAVILVRLGRARAGAFVALAFASSEIIDQLLKAAFRRARPELDDPFVQLTTYAFPSGHAFAATATYGALALVFTASTTTARRALALALAAALVALVGASRVIIGVHYLLDVFAGIAGGIAVLSALLLVFAPRSDPAREEEPEGARLDA